MLGRIVEPVLKDINSVVGTLSHSISQLEPKLISGRIVRWWCAGGLGCDDRARWAVRVFE